MTAREPLMDQAYFDQSIEREKTTVLRFAETINKPETTPQHRNRLLYSIFSKGLALIICKYSAGRSVAELRDMFSDIVQRRERHQEALGRLGNDFKAIDDYCQSIWLVCLAILLDIDLPLFDRLLACIGNEGKDKLFERFVATRLQGRAQAADLMWPKLYQPLYDAIDAVGADQQKLMSSFLKGWYPAYGRLRVYWHDCHKGPEGGGFVGYWCLEAATVVKAFSVDDTQFRNVAYYPKDFLHAML